MRNLLNQSEQFRSGRLIKTGFNTSFFDRIQYPQHPQRINISRVFRNIKTHPDMTLGTEIVNFIRLYFFKQTVEVTGIGQIAIMQKKPDILRDVRLKNMVYLPKASRASLKAP